MNQNYQELIEFLASADRPQGTLNFNQLRGFLFAVVSSPETIAPEKWMPLIFSGHDAAFVSDTEATARMDDIVNLFQDTYSAVVDESYSLPEECTPSTEVMENFDEGNTFAQWIQGFGGAHFYLEQSWLNSVPDELQDEFASCVLVLTFFTNLDMAKA